MAERDAAIDILHSDEMAGKQRHTRTRIRTRTRTRKPQHDNKARRTAVYTQTNRPRLLANEISHVSPAEQGRVLSHDPASLLLQAASGTMVVVRSRRGGVAAARIEPVRFQVERRVLVGFHCRVRPRAAGGGREPIATWQEPSQQLGPCPERLFATSSEFTRQLTR